MRGILADEELELYKRVDEVLYYVWDPIGVAIHPAARDEYHGYLTKVFTMLQEGKNASLIAAYLDDVMTDSMGLNENPEHPKRVAILLIDWKAEIYKIRLQQTRCVRPKLGLMKRGAMHPTMPNITEFRIFKMRRSYV